MVNKMLFYALGGGGRLGSILDRMSEHNFEGNGFFFSFKRMA